MVFFTAHPVYVSRTRLNAFSESWIGGKIESQRFFLLANMYNFEIETPINFASIQPSQFTSLLLSFFFSRSVSVFENSAPPPRKVTKHLIFQSHVLIHTSIILPFSILLSIYLFASCSRIHITRPRAIHHTHNRIYNTHRRDDNT